MKKYRPSNRAENRAFQRKFCCRCAKDTDNICEILDNALEQNTSYPTEWIYDKEGQPTCAAFVEVKK